MIIEGKTDYRQRHKLITQDKNKYGSPKYRLAVRITNRYIMAQVIYAEIDGDKVLCAATSKELIKHGLKVGLKNYAAAYCTGLLIARRVLTKLNLHETYTGVEEPNGEVNKTEVNGRTYYIDEIDEDDFERKPFRCFFDVGIRNTAVGARIFGALKGASDGGLDIPHNNKRFPGYTRDTKQYDADTHKGRIFGEHVAEYMREMEEDDEENYKKHFAAYIEEDITADDLEELYEKVHSSIREDPSPEEKDEFVADKSFFKTKKLTYNERTQAAAIKKAAIRKAVHGDTEEEVDEETVEEE